MAQTLFEKLWDEHRVESQDDGTDLIYIQHAVAVTAQVPESGNESEVERASLDKALVYI